MKSFLENQSLKHYLWSQCKNQKLFDHSNGFFSNQIKKKFITIPNIFFLSVVIVSDQFTDINSMRMKSLI
jgi:hypothetical protein